MSTQRPGYEPFTLPAGVDFSTFSGGFYTFQYTLVKINASGQLVPLTAATDPIDGILQNFPILGGQARIEWAGALKAKAGAAFTVGQLVCARADGTVGPPVSGATILGRALEAAPAAGVIAQVFVRPMQLLVSP